MSHSPEPWTLELNEANPIRDADGLNVTIVLGGRILDTTIPVPENLERIVACVNACRGIPTEYLISQGVSLKAVITGNMPCSPDANS